MVTAGSERTRNEAAASFPSVGVCRPWGDVSSANAGRRRTVYRTSSPGNGGSIESSGRRTVSTFGQNRAKNPLVRPFVQNLPDSSNLRRLPDGATPLATAEDCLIRPVRASATMKEAGPEHLAMPGPVFFTD
jgi:hypothetical protein